jgi:hypothetical protein
MGITANPPFPFSVVELSSGPASSNPMRPKPSCSFEVKSSVGRLAVELSPGDVVVVVVVGANTSGPIFVGLPAKEGSGTVDFFLLSVGSLPKMMFATSEELEEEEAASSLLFWTVPPPKEDLLQAVTPETAAVFSVE